MVLVVAVLVVVEAEAIAHVESSEDFHAGGEVHAKGVRPISVGRGGTRVAKVDGKQAETEGTRGAQTRLDAQLIAV